MNVPRPLFAPFAVDLVITQVWQEKDARKMNQVLTKYRLEDRLGNLIGVFTTPSKSKLSEALFTIGNRKKLGR